jgi:hypothetical protein
MLHCPTLEALTYGSITYQQRMVTAMIIISTILLWLPSVCQANDFSLILSTFTKDFRIPNPLSIQWCVNDCTDNSHFLRGPCMALAWPLRGPCFAVTLALLVLRCCFALQMQVLSGSVGPKVFSVFFYLESTL